ncbi:hypothetical protein JOC69_002719 [Heliobacterium gestii]|nr:hypothetical protein [Heliomicrobium gestii]
MKYTDDTFACQYFDRKLQTVLLYDYSVNGKRVTSVQSLTYGGYSIAISFSIDSDAIKSLVLGRTAKLKRAAPMVGTARFVSARFPNGSSQ